MFVLSFAFLIWIGAAASAQTPAPAQASAPPPAAADDDDARLDPAEPDFVVVNLPTTLRLPRHGGNFRLTHRFNENLRRDSFEEQLKNLFGLDEGASIQFEYRFGLFKHVEAIASRTNINRTIQLSTKYDAWHQNAEHPVSISGVASVEGGNNFSEDFAPALGAVVARSVASRAAFYVVPVWVHNSGGTGVPARDTGYIGIGARIKLLPTTYVVAEVTPRLGGYVVGDPEYGFAIEKRVGAHVFSLTFANSHATTYRLISRGGNPESLYLGFNLARKFF
jgi:hypothetical protein